jgi:hypothetical protein
MLVIVGIAAAFIYFADFETRAAKIICGCAHTAAHLLTYFIVLLAAANWLPNDFWIVVASGLATGITAPTVIGIYLLVLLNGWSVHWNEAFSALRIADFKGFLRLRITPGGDLEVYPIGLDSVPRDDTGVLSPRLLEGPIKMPKTPPFSVRNGQ